jgi:hypothetical protein
MKETPMRRLLFLALCFFSLTAGAVSLSDLPPLPAPDAVPGKDWLVQEIAREAGVYQSADGKALVLSNGLVRRVFRIAPNAATVALDNLMTGESVIRGVKPEAHGRQVLNATPGSTLTVFDRVNCDALF